MTVTTFRRLGVSLPLLAVWCSPLASLLSRPARLGPLTSASVCHTPAPANPHRPDRFAVAF